MDAFHPGSQASDDSPAADEPPGFSPDLVEDVWTTAEVIEGNDPALWRKDCDGVWIYRMNYNRSSSNFGWFIAETTLGHFEARHASRRVEPQKEEGTGDNTDPFTLDLF